VLRSDPSRLETTSTPRSAAPYITAAHSVVAPGGTALHATPLHRAAHHRPAPRLASIRRTPLQSAAHHYTQMHAPRHPALCRALQYCLQHIVASESRHAALAPHSTAPSAPNPMILCSAEKHTFRKCLRPAAVSITHGSCHARGSVRRSGSQDAPAPRRYIPPGWSGTQAALERDCQAGGRTGGRGSRA
jgi:hypothetical protein